MRMQRIDVGNVLIALLVVVGLAVFGSGFCVSASAQEIAGGAVLKENLDLPYDAQGEEEEEEEAPEIVVFYGQQLEGDGFFYVIDRSWTMQDKGELARAKREVVRNITELSENAQFGIVFFDANVMKYPASGQPAEATPGMKSAAVAFVTSVPGGSGTCCLAALTTALQMAMRSSAKRRVIVYLSDGGGTCQGADEATYLKQTLSAVTSQNYQRIQINTIGVLEVGQIQGDFLRRLAAANGGTYRYVGQ